jgi:hypothetical protein
MKPSSKSSAKDSSLLAAKLQFTNEMTPIPGITKCPPDEVLGRSLSLHDCCVQGNHPFPAWILT